MQTNMKTITTLTLLALLALAGCQTRTIKIPSLDFEYTSNRIGSKESFTKLVITKTPEGGYAFDLRGYQNDSVEGIRAAAEGAAMGAAAAAGRP